MKHAAALLLATALALPAQAEEGKTDQGLNLVEEGMMLFFRGLMEDIEPELEELAEEMKPALRGLADDMGPAMDKLMAMIGELDAYHPPERLPNGDIILRRKTPGELETPPRPRGGGEEIEL